MPRLEDALRATYRETFLQALENGAAKPFLIPYSLLGTHIIPMLWLTIPHVSRPWVYQTRWIVLVFSVAFNLHVLRVASSTSFFVAYSAGLMAAMGIMQTLDLLVWKRPQFEAARVIQIITPQSKVKAAAEAEMRLTDTTWQNGGTANGHTAPTGQSLKLRKSVANVPLDNVARSETTTGDDIEYEWQTFPAEAPFLDRLGWVMDLMMSLRGAGWNFSITSIPRPTIPSVIHDKAKVHASSIPCQTPSGYTRPVTEGGLLRTRLISAAIACIIIDMFYLQTTVDSFYMVGPNNELEISPLHGHKAPFRLLLLRQSWILVGVVSTIIYSASLWTVMQYYIYKTFFPSRAILWAHPSVFGNFSEVLDRGLAGWWGSWWHQTFRSLFLAPSVYLLKKGYLKKGTVAADLFGLFISFFQSGLLHAAGSYTSIPRSRPMNEFWFFMLQCVGIIIQQYLSLALRYVAPGMPRMLRRCGNVLFCLSWLSITAPLFIDDLSACGLWLHEAVPISIFRLLRLGHVLSFGRADNTWWRWDKEYFLKFYEAKHWWEVGFAL
ncbi:hypothetical protein E4U21_004327 [Claviceps maximensis]|nr:hypothetical protein E4U21_004327 [Claviceps maximensis]